VQATITIESNYQTDGRKNTERGRDKSLIVHLLTPVNIFWVVTLGVDQSQIIGIVDVLVRTLAKRDFHNVSFLSCKLLTTHHAVLETESPSSKQYVLATVLAWVICNIFHVSP
jgi:hypothetical protein